MDDLAEKLLMMLVEKIEHQAREIKILEEENHYHRDDALNLRETLESYTNNDGIYLREAYKSLQSGYNNLSQRHRELQRELDEYRRNDPAMKAAVNQYMVSEGISTWNRTGSVHGGKIPVIKKIRELTRWGLKQSKDYAEEYMKNYHSFLSI